MNELDEALAHMTEAQGARFGRITERDEYVHQKVEDTHHSVTETFWFSFGVSEENIHGQIYIWMHPNLRIASAGCWIWRGLTRHYLEADHFNFRHYLPYPTLTESGLCIPEVGLTVRIIEALSIVEVEYVDDTTNTRVQFRAQGLIPPVVRSSSKHFDQPMHYIGDMILNGEHFPLNCRAMRDKSWGERRPEIPNLNHPPVCWSVGVAEDGRAAFNFSGVDDPERGGTDRIDVFDLPPEKRFKEGWIHWKGELRKLVSMSKSTIRDADNWNRIISLVADVVDDRGAHHRIKGTMLGCVQWSAWSNILVHWNRLRWEMADGVVGYGDALEMYWAPYARHIRKQTVDVERR